MRNIKMIVLDFDGTIVRDDKSVDRGLAEVMHKLKDLGILVSFATGRNIYSTMALARQLPFELPFAINNGAMICEADGTPLASWSIPTYLNNALLQDMHTNGLSFLAYADEEVVFYGTNPVLNGFRDFLATKLPTSDYNSKRDYGHLAFYKILLDAEDAEDFDGFRAFFEAKYSAEVSLAGNEGSLFVITSPEATKGNALKYLCDKLEVDLTECMVIGDNHNDYSMMEAGGLAVAMGNSEAPILEIADIIIGSNNDDSVSAFLTEYFSL